MMCMMHNAATPWDTLPPGGTVTTTHKAAPPPEPTEQPSIGTAMTLPPPATTTLGQLNPSATSSFINPPPVGSYGNPPPVGVSSFLNPGGTYPPSAGSLFFGSKT